MLDAALWASVLTPLDLVSRAQLPKDYLKTDALPGALKVLDAALWASVLTPLELATLADVRDSIKSGRSVLPGRFSRRS